MLTHARTHAQEITGSLVSAGPTLGSQLTYNNAWHTREWHTGGLTNVPITNMQK